MIPRSLLWSIEWSGLLVVPVYLVLLITAVAGVSLFGWIVWYTVRELSALLVPRSRSARRRNLRFGFPLIFGVLTATALVGAVYAREGPFSLDLWNILGLVLSWVLLLCFFYLGIYALGDVAVSFGWFKGPGDLRRHLRGQRLADPGRGLTQEDVEKIEIPEPTSEQQDDREPLRNIKRKRRHWWARAMPDRTRVINPGKDYNVPLDRDDYAG